MSIKNNNNLLEDKYNLLSELGSGSFGSVFRAEDIRTKKEYAIKVEDKNSKSRLKNEYDIYRKLKKTVVYGIPRVKKYFESEGRCFMLMQLLGKSLDYWVSKSEYAFDLATVLKLGINIINLLESVHSAGYLHRDIKPNNFLIGYEDDDISNIYIMDFGLSKKYLDSKGKHIPYRDGKSLVGTARYASINVHKGIEPSRRDDLESVGYMLLYFLFKKLPWQGLKKKQDTDHTNDWSV